MVVYSVWTGQSFIAPGFSTAATTFPTGATLYASDKRRGGSGCTAAASH